MVKAPGKRSAAVAALTGAVAAPKLVVKLERGLQSLMDHGDNIEEFVDIFAHLPKELTADLKTVASLNERIHRLTAELSRDQAEILERAKAKLRQATAPEHIEGLIDQAELGKALEKRARVTQELNRTVEITKKMYEKLDGCINRVDDEISKLEEDVKESYGALPDYASLAPPEVVPETDLLTAGAAGGEKVLAKGAVAAAVAGKGAGKTVAGARGVKGAAVGAAQEVYNPNEPLYCICRQVGYGDMIGCDNDDCEHGEWFHYTCVGLEKVDLKFWLCPGCKRDAEEKERREQAEQLRLAAVMRTTAAANAVKVDAVKLPSEGEDGEDDSDDDDDDEEEDEAGDNGVKAEPGSEARAGARAVRDAENEESGALASPENSAAETKTEALAPSAVADTGEVVVREERKEYIAPAAATFVSGTGQLGGGNGDAIPASMQYTGDVHDKASTMPATPVGGVEASSWIGGASIRGLAGGTDTTSVEDEECVAEGGTGVSIARAEAKDADYSPDASDCGAAVVVGVPDPTIPGSDTKPSGAIVSNEGTKHKGTRIQDFVGQGVGTTTSGTSSAVFTSRPPAEQNAAHSEDGGR